MGQLVVSCEKRVRHCSRNTIEDQIQGQGLQDLPQVPQWRASAPPSERRRLPRESERWTFRRESRDEANRQKPRAFQTEVFRFGSRCFKLPLIIGSHEDLSQRLPASDAAEV